MGNMGKIGGKFWLPVLFSCLAREIACLPQDVREELLQPEDVREVTAREADQEQLGGQEAKAFISPHADKCLLIPSDTGCTTWMDKSCREEPHSFTEELYHPDCIKMGNHRVSECEEEEVSVPVMNTGTVCGFSVERDCDGPCYNCPTFCRPQQEERCWTNHKIQKKIRLCNLFDCTDSEETSKTNIGSAGVASEVEASEVTKDSFIEEKEELETFSSCSTSSVGEVCAPINCRFGNETKDCKEEVSTHMMKLTTKRCRVCRRKMTQVISVAEKCEKSVKRDCRVKFRNVWKKYCSDSDKSRDKLMSLLDIDATELDHFPTDERKENPRNNKNLDDLLAKSLDPVNNLIIETLRKINVDDLNKDSVIIITPRSTELDELEPQEKVNSETTEQTSEQEAFLESFLDELKKEEDALHEEEEKLANMEKPVDINVNVRYTFVNNSEERATSEESAEVEGQRSEAHNHEVHLGANLNEDRGRDLTLKEVDAKTSTVAEPVTFSQDEDSTENIFSYTKPSVYFSPLFQVLNDRKERFRSPQSVDEVALGADQEAFFGLEQSASTLAEADAASTIAEGLATTVLTIVPLITTTTWTTTSTTTTTTTTTSAVTSTPTTTSASTTALDHEHGGMSSAEFLKLCFYQNVGCDFSLGNRRGPQRTSPRPPPSTTSSPRPQAQKVASAVDEDNNQKLKESSQRFRLCFELGICSDAEYQEHISRSRQRPRSVRAGFLSEPVEPRPTTTSSSRRQDDKYKTIKERAVACIWRGIC